MCTIYGYIDLDVFFKNDRATNHKRMCTQTYMGTKTYFHEI